MSTLGCLPCGHPIGCPCCAMCPQEMGPIQRVPGRYTWQAMREAKFVYENEVETAYKMFEMQKFLLDSPFRVQVKADWATENTPLPLSTAGDPFTAAGIKSEAKALMASVTQSDTPQVFNKTEGTREDIVEEQQRTPRRYA